MRVSIGKEKSVLRIFVCHHEACRVIANGDPEGQIFFVPTSQPYWIPFLPLMLFEAKPGKLYMYIKRRDPDILFISCYRLVGIDIHVDSTSLAKSVKTCNLMLT